MNNLTTLPKLATEINEQHTQGNALASQAVQCAFVAGAALIQAKGQCAHGEFKTWCDDNLNFSYETVKVYMRVRNNQDEIEKGSTATLLDEPLSLRGALKLIPSTPRKQKPKSEAKQEITLSGERLYYSYYPDNDDPEYWRENCEIDLNQYLIHYADKFGVDPNGKAYSALISDFMDSLAGLAGKAPIDAEIIETGSITAPTSNDQDTGNAIVTPESEPIGMEHNRQMATGDDRISVFGLIDDVPTLYQCEKMGHECGTPFPDGAENEWRININPHDLLADAGIKSNRRLKYIPWQQYAEAIFNLEVKYKAEHKLNVVYTETDLEKERERLARSNKLVGEVMERKFGGLA